MKGSRGRVGSSEAGLLALTGCGEVGGGGMRREGLLSPCSWRLFRISRWLVVIDSIWDAFLSSQPPEASAHASSTGPSSLLLVKGISLRWRASGGCLPARSLSFFWNSVYIYSNDKGRNYFSSSNFMK